MPPRRRTGQWTASTKLSFARKFPARTLIGLEFQTAQTAYKTHFYGRDGYRLLLAQSIEMHRGIHEHAGRVLGEDHPLTRKIAAAFLKCFDEQLDWSLDDIPDDYLAYRAKLLGE